MLKISIMKNNYSLITIFVLVLSLWSFSTKVKADDISVIMKNWVPPSPKDWMSLENKIEESFKTANEKNNSVKKGSLFGPLVAVDRTDGTLFAFPQSGALWISHDKGQTFEWCNKEVVSWGFNESPTSLHISPDGKKMRIFSSEKSGFSLDGGKTWKYMDFKIQFGFEDGHVNWNGDSKTIIARSHTWPTPRMWLSRDGGLSFVEYSKEITDKINTQSMAMMNADVMLFQTGKSLVRTEDYGNTFEEIPLPTYKDSVKVANRRFIGVSRAFKNKTYWLNNIGVFTSDDNGKTWTIVGNNFPEQLIAKDGYIKSGPMFGKDENQMIVMCADSFIETLDGGMTWHKLADAPIQFHNEPWSYSFSYDPIDDIIYCNSRTHAGGPYLFGRLSLKRWGSTEKIPPTDPTDMVSKILETGNKVKLSWKKSDDVSGIAWYRIYINNELKYYTDKNEIVIHELDFKENVTIGIQAVDDWQNMSKIVEYKLHAGEKPVNSVLLKDLTWDSAKTNNGDLEILTKDDTRGKDKKPLMLMLDFFKPNPIKEYEVGKSVNGFGINVKPSWDNGVLTYKLDKKYKKLLLDVGLSEGNWAQMDFIIKVDGKEVGKIIGYKYEVFIRGLGRPAETFDIDLMSAETLSFEINIKNKRYWNGSLIILNNGTLLLQ